MWRGWGGGGGEGRRRVGSQCVSGFTECAEDAREKASVKRH